jgi:hypothetical protein
MGHLYCSLQCLDVPWISQLFSRHATHSPHSTDLDYDVVPAACKRAVIAGPAPRHAGGVPERAIILD